MLNSAVTNNKCNILDSCFNLGFDHDEDGNYYHYGDKHYSDNSTNSRKYTDIETLCIHSHKQDFKHESMQRKKHARCQHFVFLTMPEYCV